MGTRGLVHIKQDGETLVTLYRQMDCYPTGLGDDIFRTLDQGKSTLVNGFNGQKSPGHFNGMGCLAAYLVAELKKTHCGGYRDAIGGVYIYAPNASDVGEEYTYTVNSTDNGDITLLCVDYYGEVLFKGPLSQWDSRLAEKNHSNGYSKRALDQGKS